MLQGDSFPFRTRSVRSSSPFSAPLMFLDQEMLTIRYPHLIQRSSKRAAATRRFDTPVKITARNFSFMPLTPFEHFASYDSSYSHLFTSRVYSGMITNVSNATSDAAAAKL